jgi:hypothetical protein
MHSQAAITEYQAQKDISTEWLERGHGFAPKRAKAHARRRAHRKSLSADGRGVEGGLMYRMLASGLFVALLTMSRASTAEEARPPGALDSVVLVSGEVVLGTITSETAMALQIALVNGDHRTVHSTDIRTVNYWRPPVPRSEPAPPRTPRALELNVPAEPPTYRGQTAAAQFLPFLGPVFVHFAHGKPGTALASFGLHVGLSGVGAAALGWAVASGCHGSDGCFATFIAGAGGGGLAGYVTAAVIDVVFLSREREPDASDAVALGASRNGVRLALRY